MENEEYQTTWRNINAEINLKSKEELLLLLTTKTKKTINKYLSVIGFSIFVCLGLIIFLIITALQRQDDIFYLLNNFILGMVALFALISSLLGWYKLQNNRYNQPLKTWLEERIQSLTKDLTGRFRNLYLYLIPFLYILIVLSIHVYFENKPFSEVLKNEESVYGLIVGLPIGLFVSYFLAKKIRKYYKKNLEYLKELHAALCNMG